MKRPRHRLVVNQEPFTLEPDAIQSSQVKSIKSFLSMVKVESLGRLMSFIFYVIYYCVGVGCLKCFSRSPTGDANQIRQNTSHVALSYPDRYYLRRLGKNLRNQ